MYYFDENMEISEEIKELWIKDVTEMQNHYVNKAKLIKDIFEVLRQLYFKAVDCELDGLEDEVINGEYDKILYAMDYIRQAAEAILNKTIQIDIKGVRMENKENQESGYVLPPFTEREING